MRFNKLAHDVGANLGFSVLKGVALLWAVSLLAGAMAPAMLGIFLFARRVASMFANLAQLGMSQTLMRYIPMHLDDAAAKRRFVVYAVLTAAATSIALIFGVFVVRDALGTFFFPKAANAAEVVFWSSVIVASTIFHFIAYATFLGERKIYTANFLEFMNVSGFVLLILFWHDFQIDEVTTLKWLGLGSFALGLVAIVAYLAQNRSGGSETPLEWRSARREFLGYGLPRGAISFLDMSTLTVGPWLIRDDPVSAGYLLLALTVLRVVISAIMPVTQILSVVTARLVGKSEHERISEATGLLFGALLYATLPTLALLLPWSHDLLGLWLGGEEISAAVWRYLAMFGLGVLPVSIFYGMRGVIETRWHEPRNLVTIGSALAVHITMFYLLRSFMADNLAVGYAILAMFVVMGVVTVWWVRKDIFLSGHYAIGTLILVSGLTLVIGLLSAEYIGLWGAPVAFLAGVTATLLVLKIRGMPPFLGQAMRLLIR